MNASGDALFPRRHLDQFEKQISELHRCVELARVHAAQTMHQTVTLYLDAADAHEQAAAAYQLAGSNGHTTDFQARAIDFQARAMRHRQAAACRVFPVDETPVLLRRLGWRRRCAAMTYLAFHP